MSVRKQISNTFTVNTVEDGESAPYYFLEWFAWSNDPSTNSVTTAPTIGGSWATSIPAQGSYAYLWRKSIRYVWQDATRTYSAEAAQYFRMSGLDGTSIKTRGQVASASQRGNGTATLTNGTTITMSDGDAVTQLDNGHLYQWVTGGGGVWLDLGQFKGEDGVAQYSHVAWATNVTISGSTVTVTGFVPDKSPNDTTHIWMGVYVDTNSGQDSANASLYTWSNTKGNTGDPSVTYTLQPSIAQISVGRTAAGGYNPSSVNMRCGYKKSVGGTITTVADSTASFDGYTIVFRRRLRSTGAWEQYNDHDIYIIYASTAYAQSKSLLYPLDVSTYDEVEFYIATIGTVNYNGNYYYVSSLVSYVDRTTVPVVEDGMMSVIYRFSLAGSIFSVNDDDYPEMSVAIVGKCLKTEGGTTNTHTLNKSYLTLFFKKSDETTVVLSNSDYTVSGNTFSTSYLNGTTWDDEEAFVIQLYSDTNKTNLVASESIQIQKQGTRGTDGARGKVGRFFYYGNVFDSSNNTKQFLINDAQAPYFAHIDSNQIRYHVYNPTNNPAGGYMTMAQMWAASNQSWNNAPWQIMTNDFEYIITSALFANLANLGSWLFTDGYDTSTAVGRFLLSSYGVPNGGGAERAMLPTDEYYDVENANNDNDWIPNIALDALQGFASFARDKVRFNKNGDGWLANKHITWDTNGNAKFDGTIQTKAFGMEFVDLDELYLYGSLVSTLIVGCETVLQNAQSANVNIAGMWNFKASNVEYFLPTNISNPPIGQRVVLYSMETSIGGGDLCIIHCGQVSYDSTNREWDIDFNDDIRGVGLPKNSGADHRFVPIQQLNDYDEVEEIQFCNGCVELMCVPPVTTTGGYTCNWCVVNVGTNVVALYHTANS